MLDVLYSPASLFLVTFGSLPQTLHYNQLQYITEVLYIPVLNAIHNHLQCLFLIHTEHQLVPISAASQVSLLHQKYFYLLFKIVQNIVAPTLPDFLQTLYSVPSNIVIRVVQVLVENCVYQRLYNILDHHLTQ